MDLSPAFELAAVASRSELQRALRGSRVGSTAYAVLSAIGQQYEGDVAGAVRTLRHALRKANAPERCEVADLLAPILVMRERPEERDEIAALTGVLESGGWNASAHSFRAMLAVYAGQRSEARRQHELSSTALSDEDSDIVRFRVLQRLARVSVLLHDYDRALDLAASSADLCRRTGAWRAASASYSILCHVHQCVTGDVLETDRCVRLWTECARKSEDVSFERPALVAEFETAVQLGDGERACAVDRAIKSRLLPEQYAEHFTYVYASALLRGVDDLRAMRSILQILRDVPTRSRGEWSLCTALIGLAEAAEGDDMAARRSFHAACARLGRLRASDPAHERRHRRLARAVSCAVGIMIGDEVRARRILEARESQGGEGEERLPDLTRTDDLTAVDPRVRGVAAVLQHAWRERRLAAVPANLTEAEFSVLTLLAQGWTAGRIASETGRSVNTIYNHTRAILGKLDASRAPEAVARARTLGILR